MDADECQIFQEGQTPTACQVTKGKGPIIRTCPVCGDLFRTYRCKLDDGRGKYCSKSCSELGHCKSEDLRDYHKASSSGAPLYAVVQKGRGRIIRKCSVCNDWFRTFPSIISNGNGIYCSKACADVGKTKSIERVCQHCGKTFILPPTYGAGKYCCLKCYSEARRTPIERSCQNCGKFFFVTPSRVKNGFGKYCSKNCSDIANRTSFDKVCEYCGKPIRVEPNQIKRGRGRFCSITCANSIRVGEKSTNWHGGVSFGKYCPAFNLKLKEDIRKAFNWKCYLCNSEGNGRKLSIHHVDYQKSQGCKGRRWSLIPLCQKCHLKTNGRRWFWFAFLRDYWLNYYVDFTTTDLTMWC